MARERLPSLRDTAEEATVPPPPPAEMARQFNEFKKELSDFKAYVIIQDDRYAALSTRQDKTEARIAEVLASNVAQTAILTEIRGQIGNAPNKVLGTSGTGLAGTIAALVDIRDTYRSTIAGAAKWFAVAVALLGGYKLIFEVWHR